MRILVTGANGFLGSHVVEVYNQTREAEIRALVRPTSDLRWLEGLLYEKVLGDVTQSPEALRKAVSGVDLVVHLAALTKAVHRAHFHATNVVGIENLVRACLSRTTPPGCLVFVSSAGVLGPSRSLDPLTEEAEPRPVEEYSRSKLAAEKVVERYRGQMSMAILRPSAIYGPRDLEMLPAYKIINRGFAPKIGWAERWVNFCHAKDVVQAIRLASKVKAAQAGAFLIGGVNATQDDFTRLVALACGRQKVWSLWLPELALRSAALCSSAIETISRRPRIFKYGNVKRLLARNWTVDISKAQRILGYQPQFDLKTGIDDTVAWYRANHFFP